MLNDEVEKINSELIVEISAGVFPATFWKSNSDSTRRKSMTISERV
jgi:hypothetical protein